MADPNEGLRFSDIQDRVRGDTYQVLGIDPNNQDAFKPDDWFVKTVSDYFNTPAGDRGNLAVPSVEGVFPAGFEPEMIASFDALGSQFQGNPEFSDWYQEQRQLLAKGYKDPLQKNRAVGLMDQAMYGAASRRRGVEPLPTPGAKYAPTPTPTLEGEIEEAEKKKQLFQQMGGQG